MIIQLDRVQKVALLKMIKTGFINTDAIPELKAALQAREPARILTMQEAKELIQELNTNH